MADDNSPWAKPDSEFQVDVPRTPPRSSAPDGGQESLPTPAGPGVPATPRSAAGAGTPGARRADPGTAFLRNIATHEEPSEPVRPRTVALFGWTAAAIVAIGLVVVLIMTFNGTFSGPGSGGVAGFGGEPTPEENAPPLAKLCPPPTGTHTPEYAEPEPPPPGARTVDTHARISYAKHGDPWTEWNDDWSGGDLKVHYRVGQHFVTEEYAGGSYHASILSGSVPATINDGTALDLKCTGRQVAADVRTSYYPEPNRPDKIRDERITLGGRPAWITVFRLHF
ncbi:MAG: hypothetical protein ACRDUA_05005, partial [Micromonosporaceae bacterium]